MSNDLRKPDFLCIGSQKAGTTWLDKNLRHHPQIWMPVIKEVHYFDGLFMDKNNLFHKKRLQMLSNQLKKKIDGANISYAHLRKVADLALVDVIDDNWYLSLFKDAPINSIVGEITPAYSGLPDEGVAYLASLLPQVKIIHIIRNSVKRVWSHILMKSRETINQGQSIDLQTWLNLIDRKDVINRSEQKSAIEKYEKYFPSDQILYLFYDDICKSPLTLLNKVCDFLGLDYKEQYFQKTINGRFNVNPKIEMPVEIREILTERYQVQDNWIKEKFNLSDLEL